MKNKKNLILLALALVLIGWLSWYFSDKQVVKRQLIELTLNLSKKKGESTMETALKMRGVKAVLADNCTVIIPESKQSESVENDMIIRYLMHYRDRYRTLSVNFEDMLIDIPVKGEAQVLSTVLLVKNTSGKEPISVRAPVALTLKKQKDKDWLLHETVVPRVLLQ